MINEQGGINGRKINFISRDDNYSPPKTVEQVRQMVEQDQVVLLLFNTLGTPPNTDSMERLAMVGLANVLKDRKSSTPPLDIIFRAWRGLTKPS